MAGYNEKPMDKNRTSQKRKQTKAALPIRGLLGGPDNKPATKKNVSSN
jgi:hypothetical protein